MPTQHSLPWNFLYRHWPPQVSMHLPPSRASASGHWGGLRRECPRPPPPREEADNCRYGNDQVLQQGNYPDGHGCLLHLTARDSLPIIASWLRSTFDFSALYTHTPSEQLEHNFTLLMSAEGGVKLGCVDTLPPKWLCAALFVTGLPAGSPCPCCLEQALPWCHWLCRFSPSPSLGKRHRLLTAKICCFPA